MTEIQQLIATVKPTVHPDSDTGQLIAELERLRTYTHHLETRADPAGDLRRMYLAEETARALERQVQELQTEVAELRKPVGPQLEPAAISRVRRTHAQARPNPAENPAWANSESDVGILLSAYDTLARDNARWVSARDVWEAEMQGLRERLDKQSEASRDIMADDQRTIADLNRQVNLQVRATNAAEEREASMIAGGA